MSGWVRIHRGWRDSEVFGSEAAFSEREAWLWLIEHTAWKPMVRTNAKGERIKIERGQLHLSLRQLEKMWGWGKNKVARFLDRLEKHDMISGTASGQSGHIVTLRNYAKYQDDRDSRDSQSGTASGQSRDTQEEGKKIHSGSKEPSLGETRAREPEPFSLPSRIPADRWAAYEAMRVKIRKPMTDDARRLAVAKLDKLAESGWPPGDVLDQSVLNGWQGLFEIKDQGNGRGNQTFGGNAGGRDRRDGLTRALDRELGLDPPERYSAGGTGTGGGNSVARLAALR